MGAGACVRAPWPSVALVKELHCTFSTQDQFAESFAQFIKNGHWLNNVAGICPDESQAQAKKVMLVGDTRWRFVDYILPEGYKSITDEFMHENSSLRKSVSSIRKVAEIRKKRKITKIVSSDFQESYKYDPESAVFSMEDMCSLMISIIFPLYLASMEFEHWKRWALLDNKDKEPFDVYCAHPEVDRDFETEEHLFTSKETEHVQNMLLATAAFFDETELIRRVGRRGVLEEVQAALDSSPFGISVCCARAYMSYPILFANTALEKMTGYGRKELVGRNFKMLQGEDTEIGQLELMTTALKENQQIRLALTNYRKDGSKFLNMVALKPTFDHDGRCMYIIGLYYDIARREATLEELQKNNTLLALLPFLLGSPEELSGRTTTQLSALD